MRRVVAENEREARIMERGFWSELLLIDDDLEPLGGRALKIYRRGEYYGERCRKIVGSSSRARDLLRATNRLHENARRTHEAVVRSIERSIKRQQLPEAEKASALANALDSARPPPCDTCRFIAICASTGMTCGRFRAYASRDPRGGTSFPDKAWGDSFQGED